MKTAIYIGNDHIQVVTARRTGRKLRVKRASSHTLPEGAIINGVITEPQVMTEILRTLRSRRIIPRSGIQLVVDSGNILIKTSDVPIVRGNHLQAIVEAEFTDATRSQEKLLYDYSVLSPRKVDGQGATILCCAAERSLIESYIDLFVGVNCGVDCIRLGLDCVVSMCSALPEMSSSTYAVMEKDGSTLVSSIFTGGRFMFCQRYRLLSDHEGDSMDEELIQRISHIRQFIKSQNTGGELEKIYLFGFGSGNNRTSQRLGELAGIPISEMTTANILTDKKLADYQLSQYCYTTGSFFK